MGIGTWVFGCLAAISIASIIVKRPWTIVMARRSTPPEVWSTPLFLETDLVVTGAWALLFVVGAALVSLAPLWVNLSFGALLFLLGRLSPRFGSWYAARRLKAMGFPDAG